MGNLERKAGSPAFLWKENFCAWPANQWKDLYQWRVIKDIMMESIEKTAELSVINATWYCYETISGNTRQNIARLRYLALTAKRWGTRFRPATERYPANFSQKTVKMANHRCSTVPGHRQEQMIQNFDCAFVQNTFLFVVPKIEGLASTLAPPPLTIPLIFML